MTRPRKIPTGKTGIEPGSAALEVDALTTRPTRRFTKRRQCHEGQYLTEFLKGETIMHDDDCAIVSHRVKGDRVNDDVILKSDREGWQDRKERKIHDPKE